VAGTDRVGVPVRCRPSIATTRSVLEVAVCVIGRNRPKAVNRHISNGEAVLTDRQIGRHADVRRFSVGKSAPAGRCTDEVVYLVDLLLASEATLEGLHPRRKGQQRGARAVEAGDVVLRRFERSRDVARMRRPSCNAMAVAMSSTSRGSARVRTATTTYGVSNSSTVSWWSPGSWITRLT
jgi:hypothetical protein